VLKALDLYIDRFIAYKLGNFATYETINEGGKNGYTPPVAVETNRDGRLLGGRIYSCLQEKGTGPRLDNLHRWVKEMRRFILTDFPESKLSIEKDERNDRKE
jgi:hypothetical protein